MKISEKITTVLRWAVRLICLAMVLLSVEILFGPIKMAANLYRLSQMAAELEHAQEIWRAAGINDYSYDVSVSLPFCHFETTLEFEHGQLASVEEPEFVDIFCVQDLAYENLLVPEMYSRVSKEMDEIDPLETSLKVEFDPDLGFVSFYRRQCAYRTGGIGDCIYEYRFSNFTTSVDNGAE